MKVGLIYASDTGNTETIAKTLQEKIGEDIVDIHEVFKANLEEIFHQYDFFILGAPTWYDGQVQSEWEDKLDDLEKLNLTGCRVAIFGLGDQQDWGEFFCDAMAALAATITESGGEVIGHWSAEDYDFTESKSLINNDTFVGLALDEDRQSELTENRIDRWLRQLKNELNIENWREQSPQLESVL